MFKKDDYIVYIDKMKCGSEFLPNYIFKQRQETNYLTVDKDCNSKWNGWGHVTYKDKERCRYATQAEINAFEEVGKPIDVTKLEQSIENYSIWN